MTYGFGSLVVTFVIRCVLKNIEWVPALVPAPGHVFSVQILMRFSSELLQNARLLTAAVTIVMQRVTDTSAPASLEQTCVAPHS